MTTLKKEFIINVLLLVLANALIKPIYLFGIDRNIQLIVGTEEYGNYVNIVNFTFIMQFISDFGLQNYMSRYVSQDTENARITYSKILGFKVFLSLLYFLVTLGLAWIWYGEDFNIRFVAHVSLNQILVSSIFFIRANISGLGLYKTDSIISVLDRLYLILLGGLFIFSPSLRSFVNINFFVWIQTFSLLLCLLSGLFILIKHQFKFNISKLSKDDLIKLFYASIPFALIYLTSAVFYKSDNIWLVKLLPDGKQQSGIFAASLRLYEAMSMISLAFGSLLLAMFSRSFLDKKVLHNLLKTSLAILFIISLVLSFSGYFYGNEINNLLYHNEDPYWVRILSIMMICFIPGSINYILSSYLQATHREKLMLKIYVFAALLSVILNLFFVPSLKAEGSALVFLVVQLVLFIAQYYFIHKELEFEFWSAFKQLIFFIISVLVYFLIEKYVYVSIFFKLPLSATLIFILAVLLNIIKFSDLKKFVLLKNKNL